MIFLGAQYGLKPSILWHVHDGPLGGHFGYLKTLHKLNQDFYWPGLKKDLRQYIRECDNC